jgi:AcrR family transcriptional regulator
MNNRTKILACALKLFAARGYEAVSVQEIVDAAGITKPTLYHYFGSKQGLLTSLITENSAPLYARVEQAAIYTGDLPLILQQVVTAHFIFARENATFYRMQLAMWFAPPSSESYKVVSQVNNKRYRLIEALFVQAARDHGNMKGRQRAYAATLIGTINTYIGLALNGFTELDDRLVRQATHQFMHGIFS